MQMNTERVLCAKRGSGLKWSIIVIAKTIGQQREHTAQPGKAEDAP